MILKLINTIMILKHYNIKHPELITLDIRDNNIIIISPQFYQEIFKTFIQDYNFIQDDYNIWIKSAPSEFIEDWAAEVGYMLLIQGCVIQVDNEKLAQKIKNDDFKPEKVRWIDYLETGRFKNWFYVQWKKEDLYEQFKKIIPGCKPYNYYLAVPAYLYREIIDFAQEWDFKFTDKAEQFLKTASKNVIVLFDNHLKIPKNIKIPDELKDKSI